MRRLAILAVTALSLASCATSRRDVAAAAPGYDCSARRSVNGGELSVVRWLEGSGVTTSVVMMWHPRPPGLADVDIVARWEAHPSAEIDLNQGLIMFDRTVRAGTARMWKSSRQYRLTLRTRPRPPWEGRAVLAGDFQLQDGIRLSADWADVLAMSRGSERLFLVLTDRKGAVIDDRVLDRSVFEGFAPTAEAVLAETRAMAQAFRTRCVLLDTGDIIVTGLGSGRIDPVTVSVRPA
ncbi:MAG: hypothetical protein JWN66_676 [Sphingomonas bacterium]|uniref:hypothetical protein n=1 Tax=Sphingomonas bacterium TaxID=1895847 RepID=UPI002626ECC4|nr:hypothetical protein [Sphingomonas bacterium]MDB5703560.1 hypothetical protein [Sphingomonas bacterium]